MMPEKSEIDGLSPLLGFVITSFQKDYGIVGEEQMIGQIFTCAESRRLPR